MTAGAIPKPRNLCYTSLHHNFVLNLKYFNCLFNKAILSYKCLLKQTAATPWQFDGTLNSTGLFIFLLASEFLMDTPEIKVCEKSPCSRGLHRQPGGFLRPVKGYIKAAFCNSITTAFFKHVSASVCWKASHTPAMHWGTSNIAQVSVGHWW